MGPISWSVTLHSSLLGPFVSYEQNDAVYEYDPSSLNKLHYLSKWIIISIVQYLLLKLGTYWKILDLAAKVTQSKLPLVTDFSLKIIFDLIVESVGWYNGVNYITN